jgi:hypothetical protein
MKAAIYVFLWLFVIMLIADPHERPEGQDESKGARGNSNLNQ